MTRARGEGLFTAVTCACLALGAQTVVRPSFVGGPQSNYEGHTKIAVGDAAGGADFVVTSTQTGKCVQAWGVHSRRFDLPPDTAGYAFEFEVVSDQDWFNPETSTTWDNAITWFDAKGARLAQRRLYPEFRKKTPAYFRFCGTAPAGAVAAEVQFGIDVKPPILPGERVTVRKTTYTAYPKGTPPPKERLFDLHAPLVRSVFSSPSKDANLKVKYEVTDETAVDWSAVAVTDAVARTAISFTRTGDVIELAPAAPWTNGIHRLEISVRDVDGNAGLSRKIFLIGEDPRPTKVALREDGVTLVEGKPFFPIGIYGIHRHAFNRNNYDVALKDLRAAGFNFAHSYVDRFSPDFLSAAARNGLGVWTFAKAAVRGDSWFLEKGRADSSVLAWYIGDDTSMNTTPQELIDHDEAVRQLDGTRITCQADGTRAVAAKSNLQDYVNGADVFMPEIYPIDGFRDERCVAEVCRDMDRCWADIRAYGDGRRPRGVWPILQCFHGCGWKRYPTVDEMYAMGFAALVHGANGITWFMYGGEITDKEEHRYSGMFRTPEDWNCMTNLARRIESLAPVLLEPTPKQPAAPEIVAGPKLDALEQPSVSLLVKRTKDAVYVFAVNAVKERVRARFAVDVRGAGEALWEGRVVNADGGVFEDDFAPFGVHVYRFLAQMDGNREPLKAALYVDDGCRGNGVIYWAEMLRDSPDVELKLVSGADIRAGVLDDRELLVMPGGWGGPQYAAMGDAGADRLRAFVANGGVYFGTCCGIAIALNEEPGFAKRLKMLPFRRKEGPVRGGFTATVTFNRRGAEWLGIRAGDWEIRYHNGPILCPADPVPLCTEVEVLATMNCELAQKGRVVGPMFGTPAAVRAKYGKGTMLAFNCHPEMVPSTREIVVGGIRALTGRTIRLVRPPRAPRGAERVGYFTSTGELGSKAAVEAYFKLRADPAIAVEPVTSDQLAEGVEQRLDRIIRP